MLAALMIAPIATHSMTMAAKITRNNLVIKGNNSKNGMSTLAKITLAFFIGYGIPILYSAQTTLGNIEDARFYNDIRRRNFLFSKNLTKNFDHFFYFMRDSKSATEYESVFSDGLIEFIPNSNEKIKLIKNILSFIPRNGAYYLHLAQEYAKLKVSSFFKK